MGMRKNAARLTPTERDAFLAAVMTLKNTIANPGDPAARRISIYDQFVAVHLGAINITFGGTTGFNMGHQNSAFCPWHRFYLRQFEQALQAVDPSVTLPYWDWTDHFATQNIVFQDNFMGPDGTGPANPNGFSIRSGYFAFNKPGTGGNPTPLPGWWPASLAGWRVRPSLAQGYGDVTDPATGNTLQRWMDPFANLANLGDIQSCLGQSNYEGTLPTNSFRINLEAASKTHNFHHGWVGGNMGDPNSSPNDLIFFLHHCNIDRLWAMWQIDGHQGAAFYPATGRPQGHNLNDPMWPWVGTAAGYSAPNLAADIVLPNFAAAPVIHPADALDHRQFGYCYDTEAVVGIALDQTGSMLQMTPDPMISTAADVTKWEAAKRGVAALLHDCETAYTQREAYVVAGVETFRSLAVNTFTPVFAGVPYGVVKNGSVYSEAGFTTAIATQSPGGGTPIAGAILDTEATLVRPPLGGNPAHDTRYMMFLTDGMETSPPFLSTIAAAQLSDTVIFAMGFGTGTDVNYAAMSDIVSKGKAAPPSVTGQVYHGENAGEIDKFFTNSIAHALNYTPMIDPIYELFVGEHVDTPFHVNESDQSFMITVQGFDFDDANWSVCLVLPDGSTCSCDGACDGGDAGGDGHTHDHAHAAATGAPVSTHEHDEVLITSNKKNGRTTVFMNRNGADSDIWVGRWFVRVMYRMTPQNMRMFMPSMFDRLLPAGSRPVRGPVFAQAILPLAKRVPARLQPLQRGSVQGAFPVAGVNEERSGACAVSVNIYSRSTLSIGVRLDATRVAGRDFEVTLEAQDLVGATVTNLAGLGRLVAPRFSVGRAFLDQKTIPTARRRRLAAKDAESQFEEFRFLAEYEAKKPGVFAMRDEVLAPKKVAKRQDRLSVLVDKNEFSGVYRIAFLVSGTVTHGAAEPESFARLVHIEAPVGVEIDPAKVKPRVTVSGRTVTITYSVIDTVGNPVSPALDHRPQLLLNGKPALVTATNDFSGTYAVSVQLRGDRVQLAADGTSITAGTATVAMADGTEVSVKEGSPLRWELRLGDVKVPVGVKRLR